MAGPSILVRVLGDLTGLSKSFGDATSKGTGAATALHSAFSGVLSALNKTGVLGPFGDALDGIDQALDQVAGHAKEIGPAMMGVGGALAGIGVGLSALGSKDQAAHQQLQQAVEATGKSYDDYAGQVDEAVKHQEKFGDTANQTEDALRVLTQATGDPTKALSLLSEATDLAAAKHEDLGSAATQLGKVYNGNTKILKEFGIQVTGAKTAQSEQAAVTELGVKVYGQAGAAADTFGGKLSAIKATVEDAAAAFGQKYGPAITAAGGIMAGLGGAVTATTGVINAFRAAQEASTVATDGMAAAEVAADAAGLPLYATIGLIVVAVAALIAIAVLLYKNWDTIWAAMKAAAEAVWNWIQANWPLLLGILTGPIGLAAAAIYKYWDQIQAGLQAVWNWIKANWPLIAGILTGGVSVAITWIVQHTNDITGAFQAVLNWLRSAWQTVSSAVTAPFESAFSWLQNAAAAIASWFSGVPGAIANIFYGVANSIERPFFDAFDAIANVWNWTVGSLSFKIPGWVPGLGGDGFSMPKIPTFATGGIVTGPTLALIGEAGPEAVVPLNQMGRSGPAVHIENATFSKEIDIDTFMRRVAWTARTAKA